MRRSTRTALGILPAVLFLASQASAGEEIRFDVPEGTWLVKNVIIRHELNLDEKGLSREGGPLMREELGGWLTAASRINVLDEYVSVGAGRPQVLRRKFRDISGHAKANLAGGRGVVEERTKRASPLKGQTLLYTWVEEEGEYGRTYDHLYGDEELLEGLIGDMDCLALLPPGPVEVGASWEIDPEVFRSVLGPGGNLAIIPDEEGYFPRMVEVGLGGDLSEVLGRKITGAGQATFTGVREVGGKRFAEIALVLTVASRRDRTGAYLAGLPTEERKEAASLQGVTVDWSRDGTGLLLWDLEEGRAESLRVEGHEVFLATVEKLSTQETAKPMLIGQHLGFSGQLEIEFDVRKGSRDEPDEQAQPEPGQDKAKPPRKKKGR